MHCSNFHSWNEWGSTGSASQSNPLPVQFVVHFFTESHLACNNQLKLKEQLDIVRSEKLKLSAENERLRKIINSKKDDILLSRILHVIIT